MTKSRVLIVDDSPQMVQTIDKYLSAHGFDIVTATSGDDAIHEVRTTQPDAVVTDLRMNGLDGVDVLEIIRDSQAGIPVIIMTAFGSVENAVEATQRGAFHYLTKPFRLATLRTLLERAVSRPAQGTKPPADERASQAKEAAPSPSGGGPSTGINATVLPGEVSSPSARGNDPFTIIARDSLPLREVERRYTSAVLQAVGGNKTRAAEILGVDPSTLYRRGRRADQT